MLVKLVNVGWMRLMLLRQPPIRSMATIQHRRRTRLVAIDSDLSLPKSVLFEMNPLRSRNHLFIPEMHLQRQHPNPKPMTDRRQRQKRQRKNSKPKTGSTSQSVYLTRCSFNRMLRPLYPLMKKAKSRSKKSKKSRKKGKVEIRVSRLLNWLNWVYFLWKLLFGEYLLS